MPHSSPRRRRLSGNKSDHRFPNIISYILGSLFLGCPPNFADHHDRISPRILIKQFQGIDKISSNNWISSDPNTCRLPDPAGAELPDCFVSQSPASGDHSSVTFTVDSSRHDPNLAFTW